MAVDKRKNCLTLLGANPCPQCAKKQFALMGAEPTPFARIWLCSGRLFFKMHFFPFTLSLLHS